MLERIVMCVCCIMCSIPFLIISLFDKDSGLTPIPFWSGSENNLKKQLKDIKGYNAEMAIIYKKYAMAFGAAAIGSLIYPLIGIVTLVFNCTVGIYLVYKKYKLIVKRYSI